MIVDGEIVCLLVFLMKSVRVKNLVLVTDLCMSDLEACVTLYHGLVQHIGNVCSPFQPSAHVLKVFSILQ